MSKSIFFPSVYLCCTWMHEVNSRPATELVVSCDMRHSNQNISSLKLFPYTETRVTVPNDVLYLNSPILSCSLVHVDSVLLVYL